MASQPQCKHLVVDSAPLFTSTLESLRGLAQFYLVTPDVVAELRDKRGRKILDEAELHLPGWEEGKPGFAVREPSAEAVARVTSIARQTGDIAVLSQADIRVLALCVTLELEENGPWRLREKIGQAPPQKPPTAGGDEASTSTLPVEEVTEALEKVELHDEVVEEVQEPVEQEESVEQADSQEAAADEAAATEDVEDGSSSDSDSDGGEWITPENIASKKNRDLGLFAAPADGDKAGKPKTVLKAAVLTGDYAMQNVGLQMGLNVLGSGGQRIRNVKTWILRCYGCYKLCKDPEKRFCPSCGGNTLTRVSITYVPATPENPRGYIVHLKSNFVYNNRGTKYSLPTPKPGQAKGGGGAPDLILREDQKEWARGVRSAEVRREKENRAMIKAAMVEKERVDSGLAPRRTGTGMDGFGDPDWLPPMLTGGMGSKQRRGNEVRTDKSGMPVVGAGRRNPNQARKKTK